MRLTAPDMLAAVAGDRLHLILYPTEACNFRCSYCYEVVRGGKMASDVVTGIKNLLRARMADLSALSISWFGGEPLLALDIIKDISRHIRTLICRKPQLAYGADMTTNGYLLTPGTLKTLVCLGVREFQIAFDGPRDVHDKKRVLAGGKGTFDRIWGNLLDIRNTREQCTILVRLHLDKENYRALPPFVDEYARVFGGDSRFRLFARPLSRLGCPDDAHLPVFSLEQGHRRARQVRAYAQSKGARCITTSHFIPICYAARLNSLAIRADGAINKCTVKLYLDENRIGHILPNGSLVLDRDRLFRWCRGLESGRRSELACPALGE
ncbi:MAG: radical SAM protein [Planctomycetota bacterium]|nr:radical SAM protein [Planctomycetota bacterium]